MRFIGVAAPLEIFVPNFEGFVIGARHEFSVADFSQAIDLTFVHFLGLEFFFKYDHVFRDRHRVLSRFGSSRRKVSVLFL